MRPMLIFRDPGREEARTPSSGMPEAPLRVIAAVIGRADTLLLCQRPPHKRHGGLWEFPGGKLEPGESDADAARR